MIAPLELAPLTPRVRGNGGRTEFTWMTVNELSRRWRLP